MNLLRIIKTEAFLIYDNPLAFQLIAILNSETEKKKKPITELNNFYLISLFYVFNFIYASARVSEDLLI